MQPSSSNHSYAPSAYDDDMCLKPSLLLWLTLIWLARATWPASMPTRALGGRRGTLDLGARPNSHGHFLDFPPPLEVAKPASGQ